jgi:hypothetical protein
MRRCSGLGGGRGEAFALAIRDVRRRGSDRVDPGEFADQAADVRRRAPLFV